MQIQEIIDIFSLSLDCDFPKVSDESSPDAYVGRRTIFVLSPSHSPV